MGSNCLSRASRFIWTTFPLICFITAESLEPQRRGSSHKSKVQTKLLQFSLTLEQFWDSQGVHISGHLYNILIWALWNTARGIQNCIIIIVLWLDIIQAEYRLLLGGRDIVLLCMFTPFSKCVHQCCTVLPSAGIKCRCVHLILLFKC